MSNDYLQMINCNVASLCSGHRRGTVDNPVCYRLGSLCIVDEGAVKEAPCVDGAYGVRQVTVGEGGGLLREKALPDACPTLLLQSRWAACSYLPLAAARRRGRDTHNRGLVVQCMNGGIVR